MTLSPASPAPGVIRCLALIVREGVTYSRGARMMALRKWYKPQLRKRYRRQPRVRVPIQRGDRIAEEVILRPGPVVLTCQYPPHAARQLSGPWTARFYERLEWPVLRRFVQHTRHPFRLFLDLGRGSRKLTIPIHDTRNSWFGSDTKMRLRILKFPLEPGFPLMTYIAFGDGLSDLSLCRWLTVILAQRSMLTVEEEWYAVEEFFVSGSRDDLQRDVRRETYRVMKNKFVQPVGGRPSFPLYYQRTLKMLELRQKIETRETRPLDLGTHVALKELRWGEPNLHRALLDRIATGRVSAIKRGGQSWVDRQTAERVEQERQRNAEARQAKRFPGRRVAWINQLVAKGERPASATRKIKRWINDLKLSEEEIQASIYKGRVARRSKPSSAS